MKAIIYHSLSKRKRSFAIANQFEGDKFEIKSTKKTIKWTPLQMFFYGYLTTTNKKVDIQDIDIDLTKYDEIYLVSPVWAGRINPFMKEFLKRYPLEKKKIHIIGSCDGGYSKYFDSFEKCLDESNEIVEELIYVKGVKE